MTGSRTIDVGVSRRVLWVGDEAYPLQNIARARTSKLVPRRWPTVRGCIVAVALWMAVELVGATALRAAGLPGSVRVALIGYLEVGAAVLTGIYVVRLLIVLARRTLYALVIETAGRPFTAVISRDRRLINHLVHQIMEAIDNPAAEFHHQIQNIYGGNHVTVGGHDNIGMVNNN